MRKPILSDYELSKDKISEYEKSLHRYNLALEKQNQENKIYNKKALIGVIIMMIIYGIMFYVLGYAIGGWVLLIYFGLQTIVTSILSSKDNTPRDDFILLLILVTSIPLLGFGSLIYGALSHDENFTNSQIPKSRYIDTSIEKKINEYKNDLEEWEQWQTKTSPEYWKNLSGYEFEKEIAKLYKKLGYGVTVTPQSGDGGVDIILEKDGKRIAVQCKHHAKPVGPAPVRELLGVVASQDFDCGIFISLNGYTKNAISEANLSKVQISLLSLYDILALLKNQSSTYDSIGINDDSYVEEDKKKSGIIAVPTNIPIYENLKNEINIKDNDYLLQYEENFDKILEYIKNHEPFDYGSSTTPEEDKENAELFKHSSDYLPEKYKMEFFTYVDFEIIVYKNSYSFEPVYIEIHHFPNCDERRIFNYFLKKYDLILDYTINRIKGVSDEELILRANYISECISIYPQKNIDPSYWFSKSRNDLKTYIESFSFMQTGNDKKPSANAIKYCLDNCSTCNRDTCILDDSK